MMLAIVFGIMNLVFMQQLGRFQDQELSRVQFARFQGTAVMPGASGVLLVTADKQQGILVVSALEALDQTKQYQLWLIKDGRRTNGGVFSVSSAGDAYLIVSTDIPLSKYDAFGVTVEPFGGSQGPTGPKVLGGSMVL
jgi:anti-sigma-K factor RskA